MNKAEIHQKIEAEIAKTGQLIQDYKELTQPIAPDDAIGRVSRMDAINNKSVTEAALRKAEEKLTMLRHVKSKIDDPDFGLCARCHSPIPIGRILFKPESSYCVNCAR